ncbi:MAG: type II toxin-antitoxin system VapC family toxin [Reyranella sp.]|nr:type II toxin-antitoxin system VapC family toxin [Reyranella sp.]
MKLLIDSNALIWAVSRPSELTATARQALQDPDNDRFVSIAAMWEIAIKISVGKLSLPDSVPAALAIIGADPLPIVAQHVVRVQALPLHHRDPFDRMMIAQAIEEGLTIVTRDRVFRAYGVPLLAA